MLLLEVLVDGYSRRQPIMPKGKTRGGQSVLLAGKSDLKAGDLVMARVKSSSAKTLLADFEKFS